MRSSIRIPDDSLAQLSALVRRDRAALIAVARAEGASPEEALECVQDALCTFLTWINRDEVRGEPERELAAVKAMVRNAMRNLRRRHHRLKAHESLEDDIEPAAPTSDGETLLVHAEDVVRLRACVAELCSVQRAVVMLRLLDERSGDDVARELGLSRAYVDVLVHRAKASLRVCMRHGAG